MDKTGKIIEISSVGSTNNFASELLKKQKLADETIIWTRSQTKGRGQRGNNWISEDNKNITCSIVLSPQFLPLEKQFFLSVITSVSIIDFLKNKVNNLKIKWPNDIYHQNSKLGGILVENSISGSVLSNSIIGIGLNINQKKFPKELPNPVSLANISGQIYDLNPMIGELSDSFSKYYNKLRRGLYKELKDEYIEMIYLFGKHNQFKDSNGLFSGEIIDILETGEIIINDESNIKRAYLFKEVEFVK